MPDVGALCRRWAENRFASAKVLKAPLVPSLGIGAVIRIVVALAMGGVVELSGAIAWIQVQWPRAGIYVLTAGISAFTAFALLQ